jgi:hypothetical protein
VQTVIAEADATDSVTTVELEGQSVVPLRLWVFTAEAGDEHRFETVDPFVGRCRLQFLAAGAR